MSAILSEISENLQRGKAKVVRELVQNALDEGLTPKTILDQGLLHGMDIIGVKFKNDEVYVPEVLVAARAMNMGLEVLKPHLDAAGEKNVGRVLIGTVSGDMHDIGKNLVKLMLQGKGLDVVDLGVDVPAERFLEAYRTEGASVICCSALLTTTMGEMKNIVDLFTKEGLRDQVKIMIGGAPINQEYCDAIGADAYAPDAASAAEVARSYFVS